MNNSENNRELRAIKELVDLMNRNDVHLQKSRDTLAEHYSGGVILVQCFDPETQACCTRFVTIGDPLSARQLAENFLKEQQLAEEYRIQMRLRSQHP